MSRGNDANMKKVNLQSKFELFSDHWSPKVIAEMNEYQFKLVKIKEEFTWHQHDTTDEVFLVIEGKMGIEFEDQKIELNTGEMIVIPKGMRHRPYASEEAKIMIIEPKGIINTGDEKNEFTTGNDQMI